MKPVNIVLLVLAGAIGGAVVMRVAQKPRVAAPAVSAVKVATPAAPVAEMQPVKPAPIPQPATPEPAVTPPTSPPAEKPAPPTHPKTAHRPPVVAQKHTAKTTVAAVAVPPKTEPEPAPPVIPAAPPAAAPPPAVEQPAVPQEIPPARTEVENATPPPPPAPEPPSVTLNAGMLISVRLVDGLSSQRNAPGDAFSATLDRELVADGFVIAERGARVEGRVISVDRGSKTARSETLEVELTHIRTSDGQTVRIETEPFVKHSEPSRGEDATKVVAGAAIGAVIGGLAGGGKGAAIGAGAGGGAGAGAVLLTHKPATLPSETRVTFRLKTPVKLTEQRG